MVMQKHNQVNGPMMACQSVWLRLAKFHNFGEILEAFDRILDLSSI